MNVLIAYECSGNTRNAFRDLGYNAFSVDLKPSKDDSPFHFTSDALEIMMCHNAIVNADQWDLIIMHPDCTALAVSGNSTYAKGKRIMPQFQVDITRTVTNRYFVTAKDYEEAEDIALFGDLDPVYIKDGDEVIDTEEIK